MVVGNGFHMHQKPGGRPDLIVVKNLVDEQIADNGSRSRGDMYREVVRQHGCASSLNSVRGYVREEKPRNGNDHGLKNLKRRYCDDTFVWKEMFIQEVHDEREMTIIDQLTSK